MSVSRSYTVSEVFSVK